MNNYVYGTQFFQDAFSAVTSSAKKAVGAVGSFAKQQLDSTVEQKIEEISTTASDLVAEKIHAALYREPTMYGKIQGTQQKVDLYYVNSNIINNVLKAATGRSLDDFINQLPVGLKQLTGFARAKLENVIANTILHRLAGVSIKPLIAKILHESYGFSQEKVQAYLDAMADSSEPLQEIINDSQLKKAATNNAPAMDDDSDIGLLDVIKYYQYRVEAYLNDTLRTAVIDAAAQAAQTIAMGVTESAINQTTAAVTVSALGTIPILGVGAGLAGIASTQFLLVGKEKLKELSSEKAYQRMKTAAERLVPQEIIPVHYEYAGRTFEENVQIDAGQGEEWDFCHMTIIAPTFSQWISTKYGNAASHFYHLIEEIQNHWSGKINTSAIPTIYKNWLQDNDFPKLDAMRKAYISAENKLHSLDLTLMNLCEFASGIRTDVDGETFDFMDAKGLDKCQQKLAEIQEQTMKIQQEAKRVAQNHLQVDNVKRRNDLVIPANAALDKLATQINQYAQKVQIIINEAQKMTQEKAVTKKAASI